MGDGQDRSEKATPRRRKEARRKGEIGNTPEFGAWVAMLVASFVLPWVGRETMTAARELLARVDDVARTPDVATDFRLLREALWDVARTALPIGVLVMVVAVAAVVGQGGFAVAPKLWVPKAKRLDPLSGLKRMFGPHGAWALAQAVLKSVVVGAVVWAAVRHLVPSLAASGALPVGTVVDLGLGSMTTLIRWTAAAGLLLAVADYAMVRKRNNKALKMTKQEVKDEFKHAEGDPMLKGARRSRAIALTRNRMFVDVAEADVLLVNPTHVAVALRYDPAKGAPRVVAKGADHVAARLRELADEHRVPMVVDVPLARTLHTTCEVGQEIPPELFHAVAVVLAFLLRLRRRGSVAGLHRVPVAR